MTKVIFACDESGAKGYADHEETYPGETGVFAGIMVPDEMMAVVSPSFQVIHDRYKPENGKLHIADLSAEKQKALREDIFQAIRQSELPCFWYAIHVAGFHEWYKANKILRDETKRAVDETRRGEPPRVKRGSPRDEPESLHVALFEGLYSHLIAFLIEHEQKRVAIEVRTDQIDSPIVKEFEAVAKRLLETEPTVTKYTGFDTFTKQVVSAEIRTEVTNAPDLQIEAKNLTLNVVRDGDGLVLAADVLANSLNYFFKTRSPDELYGPLNSPDAIAAHPLAQHLDSFLNWGAGDIIGDCLFRHPKSIT